MLLWMAARWMCVVHRFYTKTQQATRRLSTTLNQCSASCNTCMHINALTMKVPLTTYVSRLYLQQNGCKEWGWRELTNMQRCKDTLNIRVYKDTTRLAQGLFDFCNLPKLCIIVHVVTYTSFSIQQLMDLKDILLWWPWPSLWVVRYKFPLIDTVFLAGSFCHSSFAQLRRPTHNPPGLRLMRADPHPQPEGGAVPVVNNVHLYW